ncbi:unnamed protein product [Psylliodes chrysocephalus]|uniref:Novel STAND NTPase 3 domain-containing protein n=1 Tax=Psylliodes chrysocephalus TaxID=3402493 RepID=A0A9P0CF32_9CUCU|nr:unnamed protein product [Psylliodes chrysocephala]
MSDFSVEIQNKIFQKQIIYQGCSVPLKDVIHIDNYKLNDDIIDEPTLLTLLSIDKKVLIINNTLENFEVIPLYVNRTFIEINKEKYPDYYENTSIESSNELSEEEFCSKITDQSNNKFITLIDFPGMGKSTILNRLCQLLRKTQYWIIKINLNEHTKILFKLSKEHRRSISLDEFLDLLQYPDALDEISPEYSDLVLNSLISIASNDNIRKIVLTSRPHILKHLKDKNMECSVFALQKFSKEENIDYLSNLWCNKLNIEPDQSSYKQIKEFANNLIRELESMTDIFKIAYEEFETTIQTDLEILDSSEESSRSEFENSYVIIPLLRRLKFLFLP